MLFITILINKQDQLSQMDALHINKAILDIIEILEGGQFSVQGNILKFFLKDNFKCKCNAVLSLMPFPKGGGNAPKSCPQTPFNNRRRRRRRRRLRRRLPGWKVDVNIIIKVKFISLPPEIVRNFQCYFCRPILLH